MKGLTHYDEHGRAIMVDVAGKADTTREATAAGSIMMKAQTLELIQSGRADKGDVLAVARIAAIQSAKRTAELIPLCHPLFLSAISVEFRPDPVLPGVTCEARVKTTGKTGVEMEALTAVSVALLTIYDMCKSVDRGMVIESIRLLEKKGGKSGRWQAA
jgi:cyclic pyranopterin phosphate synthase